MELFICLAAGMLAGICFGGWKALRHARRHELEKASKSLRWGSFAAGGFAMAFTTLTLGWPMKESTVSVPEEVTRTVVETVQVPVEVTKWFFFKTTTTETQEVSKEITDTVARSHKVSELSAWLLIPMMIIGFIGRWLYRRVVQTAWRWL